jgi:hypothetical protein
MNDNSNNLPTVTIIDDSAQTVKASQLVEVRVHGCERPTTANGDVLIEGNGTYGAPFEGKAFFLSTAFDWTLGKNEYGQAVLIPLRRG